MHRPRRSRCRYVLRASTAERVALDEAEAILCTGLNDDRSETADDYRPLLEKARARNLPFVCANPDLVVDVGGRQYLCAGAIADLYERMDGQRVLGRQAARQRL